MRTPRGVAAGRPTPATRVPMAAETAAEVDARLKAAMAEYGPALLEYIRKRLAPALAARVGAEDVLQEVWIRFLRQPAAPGGTPVLAYLHTVAQSCIVAVW